MNGLVGGAASRKRVAPRSFGVPVGTRVGPNPSRELSEIAPVSLVFQYYRHGNSKEKKRWCKVGKADLGRG